MLQCFGDIDVKPHRSISILISQRNFLFWCQPNPFESSDLIRNKKSEIVRKNSAKAFFLISIQKLLKTESKILEWYFLHVIKDFSQMHVILKLHMNKRAQCLAYILTSWIY